MRAAEGSKPGLSRIVGVWVAVIECRSQCCQNKKGLEVTLKQHVDVYPLADVAAHAHVALRRIKDVAANRTNAVLNIQPISVSRHIVAPQARSAIANSGNRRRCNYLLVHYIRAKKVRQIEVLRNVWSNSVTWRQTAEKKLRRNHPQVVFRTFEIRAEDA